MAAGAMTLPGLFEPIRVSSKFAICGLPLTGDTYHGCPFGCVYCYANNRVIGKPKTQENADIPWLRRTLSRVFDEKRIDSTNFLDVLLTDKITWHIGGLADPFQPREKSEGYTRSLTEISRNWGCSILFSTKSADLYHWDSYTPDLHSFQMSVTSLGQQDIEPNIPNLIERLAFFHKLKDAGFKVGIRIQPFLPGITSVDVVDTFKEADYFSIEGLKLTPQNPVQKELMMKRLGLRPENFIQMGLLNLTPEFRMFHYKGIIARLEEYGIPYSLADNDMHHISSGKCCCGDPLIKKSTDFNNTAMFKESRHYTLNDVKSKLGKYAGCEAAYLFMSNRQEGCETVADFYEKRFDREAAPMSKKFQFAIGQKQANLEVERLTKDDPLKGKGCWACKKFLVGWEGSDDCVRGCHAPDWKFYEPKRPAPVPDTDKKVSSRGAKA